jgi:VanZ family protein
MVASAGIRVRCGVWFLYVLAWSAALLTPAPVWLIRAVLAPGYSMVACKILHVAAYAVLAGLSGWLRVTGRLRWFLLAFLSAHAGGTEYFQQFVPTRTGSWRDVGLNHLGLVLGLALSWKWWLAKGPDETCPGGAVPGMKITATVPEGTTP